MEELNYKGQYYDEQGNEIEEEKYTCPTTGAHFWFEDITLKLEKIREIREKEELSKSLDMSPEVKIHKVNKDVKELIS